ncbi:MAG TPA: META domain-containing protein [Candidatus Paceibacterota bacterium]
MNKKKIIYAIAAVAVIAIIALVWTKGPFGGPKVEVGCEDGAVFNTNTGTPCVVTDENGATTTVSSLNTKEIQVSSAYSRISSEWAWKGTEYKAGLAPSKPASKGQFSMVLNPDGKVVIAGDCNSINGSFELGEDTVSGPETIDELALGKMKFSELASTKKYCAKSLEQSFVADLGKVVSYEMRPSGLALVLANGQGVMSFEREATTEGQ